MDEHLTDDDLAALELGELPAPPRRHLVALHLKLGCPECLARSGDRLVPVLDPQWNGDTQPDLGGRRGLQYDFILKSAIRTALSKLPEIEAARKQAQSEVCGEARLVEGRWPRCTPELRKARVEAWLEEAQASRRDPVDEYLVLAGVAAAYAKKLEPKGEAADVRALAFAEAANAQRR
ncbi:MAG TPA: hypothetical protein VN851_15720, partial [Thermoanaerobaculia bacterium]|nr:hypothetical protein [Thermoanaerobaculia bacterium]